MDFADFAPAPRAAQNAPAGAAAPAPAAVAAEAPATPPAANVARPAARFIEDPDRPISRVVVLDFPIAYGDREYHAIIIRRPTTLEVGRYFERLAEQADDDTKRVHFPLFVDEDGEPVPGEVLDALEADDDEEVQSAALDFLPRRLSRFAERLRGA